jgi:predicted permease
MSTRDEDDFAREIDAHLAHETDRLVADGLSPDAARARARRAFGNVTLARERFHEASRRMWLAHLAQDLRYGARTLRRSPAFALTTVLTLAVALALTTGAFTVFNAYVLRPFAVRDPGGLHQVSWYARQAAGRGLRWDDVRALRARADLFTDVVGASTRYVSSNGRPLAAELVSDNYFEALEPALLLGRGIGAGDGIGASGLAVVLGHQAWARLFDRDPRAVGRELELNGRAFVVVGVLGPRFSGLHAMPRDIWLPLTAYAAVAAPELVGGDQPRVIDVTVRLRPGVAAQAEAAITPLVGDASGADDRAWAAVRPHARPAALSLRLVAALSPAFVAFGLVLVTACANVSTAMLARASVRQREVAIRLAVGASRSRIVRQLLTEGILISMLAVAVSLVLTVWGLRVATTMFFATLPPSLSAIIRLVPPQVDRRVLLFAIAAGVACTLAFALLPALQASTPASRGALGGHGTASRRSSRARGTLVSAQVAVSVLLVVPALTLARNGAAIRDADVGFEIAGVTSVHVREGDAVDRIARLARVMRDDPRFAHAAVTSGNPLFGPGRRVTAASGGRVADAPLMYVSAEYFATLRIPILRGRVFEAAESRAEPRVAIVSAATARTFWPGADPIGQTLRLSPTSDHGGADAGAGSRVTVVGTAGDIVGGTIIDGPEATRIYLPTAPGSPHATALLVRARGGRDLGVETLQAVLKRAASDPEIFEALPLEDVRTVQVYPFVAASWIGAFLGAVALVLGVSGLFGVLTYSVTQRTREIGIRMALGATTRLVVGLVLGQTVRLAGFGALAGLAAAFSALKMLSAAVRFEALAFIDGVALLGGVTIVLAAAAAAACQPARRAARVDPAQTLRADA